MSSMFLGFAVFFVVPLVLVWRLTFGALGAAAKWASAVRVNTRHLFKLTRIMTIVRNFDDLQILKSCNDSTTSTDTWPSKVLQRETEGCNCCCKCANNTVSIIQAD